MFNLSEDLKKEVEKKSGQFYDILKRSLKIKDEEVLIISDYGLPNRFLSTMLGYGYYHAAKNKGLKVNVLFQEAKKGFMQVEPHVLYALENLPEKSIVIVSATDKLGRFGEEKSFRGFCKEKGHRFISATGLGDVSDSHFELFLEAMNINYKRLQKQSLAIKKKWDKAKEIRVKTEAGTDLIFDVEGMQAVINIGEYHEPGSGGNIPAGEVYIPPREGKVQGKVVIDGSIKTEQGTKLVDEPVILFIEEGKIVRMEGKYASLLEASFQKFEDRAKYPEKVRSIGELGLGLNPGAVLIGSMIMDEKALGTAHIGIGSNYWFGGPIKTIYHADQVFKKPVFYVDGEKMEI